MKRDYCDDWPPLAIDSNDRVLLDLDGFTVEVRERPPVEIQFVVEPHLRVLQILDRQLLAEFQSGGICLAEEVTDGFRNRLTVAAVSLRKNGSGGRNTRFVGRRA